MAARSKLSLRTTEHDLARALAGTLENLIDPAPDAVTQFEEGPGAWRVEAYFAGERDVEAVGRALKRAIGREPPPLELASVPDLNWVAISQAALPPVCAGRFVVHGSHDRSRVPRGPNAILIDAGEAFGTAHHATRSGLMAIGRHTSAPCWPQCRMRIRRAFDRGAGAPRAESRHQFDPRRHRRRRQREPTACSASPSPARGVASWLRHRPFIANIHRRMRRSPRHHRRAPGGIVVLSGILEREAALCGLRRQKFAR
jgi:ribosomal protein L11 methylase PrmA